MCWRLMLLNPIFVAGFVPVTAPIQWMRSPGERYVLTSAAASLRGVSSMTKLTMRHATAGMPPNDIPSFTVNPDRTITSKGTNMCLEASWDSGADVVAISRCTGRTNQMWDVLASRSGRMNRIQLKGTNRCLLVNDKQGRLDGALVELRNCDDETSESWALAEEIPFPPRNSSQHLASASAILHAVLAILALGVVSVGAWLWRSQSKTRVEVAGCGGMPFSMDQSGVSLSVKATVPAVMQLSPELDEDAQQDGVGDDVGDYSPKRPVLKENERISDRPVNLREEPTRDPALQKFSGVTVEPGVVVELLEERDVLSVRPAKPSVTAEPGAVAEVLEEQDVWALVRTPEGTGWMRQMYFQDRHALAGSKWETADMPSADYQASDYPDELSYWMAVCREHADTILPLFEQLQQRDFFAIFPFDMVGQCRYFSVKDSACDVDECEIKYVRTRDVPKKIMARDETECEFKLDGWTRKDMPSDFTEYYDLREEPERDTGYNGSRVWRFIHQVICFQIGLDLPQNGWKRDFNRAVSGMHAAVDAQIVADIGFNEEGIAEYTRRLRNEPGCIANLYFAYMLTLEAIRDTRKRLDNCNYIGDGEAIRPIMQALTSSDLLNSEPVALAAKNLRENATGKGAEVWKARLRIRDLFAIMDCVSCNLCKLHGKVMTLGLGSTFQVLLGDDGRGGDPRALDRKEVGALVATAAKFGKACATIERYEKMLNVSTPDELTS